MQQPQKTDAPRPSQRFRSVVAACCWSITWRTASHQRQTKKKNHHRKRPIPLFASTTPDHQDSTVNRCSPPAALLSTYHSSFQLLDFIWPPGKQPPSPVVVPAHYGDSPLEAESEEEEEGEREEWLADGSLSFMLAPQQPQEEIKKAPQGERAAVNKRSSRRRVVAARSSPRLRRAPSTLYGTRVSPELFEKLQWRYSLLQQSGGTIRAVPVRAAISASRPKSRGHRESSWSSEEGFDERLPGEETSTTVDSSSNSSKAKEPRSRVEFALEATGKAGRSKSKSSRCGFVGPLASAPSSCWHLVES